MLYVSLCIKIIKYCINYIAKDIERCKAGDSVCLPRVINNILQTQPLGHQGLYLMSVDPFRINVLDIVQDKGNRPVSIKLKFRNLDLMGLSKSIVDKAV